MVTEDVIVVDDKRQFLEKVPPAVARYALKHNYAQVLYKTPFTIKLSPGLDECPRPARSAFKPVEVVRVQRAKGKEMNYNPASTMMNAIDFFDSVDKSRGGDGVIWAKATTTRGAQVIMEVKASDGTRFRIPPVKAGDPVCLSKYAPFDALKTSPDLLQCAVNGLIRLMTSQEAQRYFENKANVLKTSPIELMKKSEEEAHRAAMAKPLTESQVDTSQQLSSSFASIDDIVNPRLHSICAGVSAMLDASQRTPVNQVMAELLDLEDCLTMEDLEYVRSQGFYPTVKNWAEKKQRDLAQSSGLIPETDELS